MNRTPYPELDELLHELGQVGKRLDEIKACEGAAGNISVSIRRPVEFSTLFPLISEIKLPLSVPEMAGVTLLISGSGCRLREISDDPTANIACIVVKEGGTTGTLFTSLHRSFERVTSEFTSHLAVHYDQMTAAGNDFHAIIHAQPMYLTYLSHIPCYQDEAYLNAHLLRWQPETIINLPEGIGFIPFYLPSSSELMAATVASLQQHKLAVWAKHGVMTQSSNSVMYAVDLIEYAETASRYEYLNLTIDQAGEGLSNDEIRSICQTFNISQKIF